MQKHVNLVDLVKSFPTNIYLQNLASIQKRTSPVKFEHLSEKSGKGSISNLSTKVVDEGETAARFGSSGTNAQDFQIVQTVSGLFFVFVLLCAAIMKVRNTEERIEFNKRFVRINNWCAENPEFVWLPGNDAPEGYDDAKEAQKAAS